MFVARPIHAWWHNYATPSYRSFSLCMHYVNRYVGWGCILNCFMIILPCHSNPYILSVVWNFLTAPQIISFLIIAKGLITSKFIIYEQLFNPILSDSFGFTVKDTSYFFVLLLPAQLGVLVVWVSEYYCFEYLLVTTEMLHHGQQCSSEALWSAETDIILYLGYSNQSGYSICGK